MGTTRLGALDGRWHSFGPISPAWPERRTGPASPAGGDASPPSRGFLEGAIRNGVLPRLLSRSRGIAGPVGPQKAFAPVRPTDDDIETVASLTVEASPAPLTAYVERMLDDGFTLEQVYSDVLTPAARRLGVWWEHDGADFAQVTLGTSRLHRLVHDLSPRWLPGVVDTSDRPTALLATVPGSQHTFGVLILAEFFRRAGWNVWSDPSVDLAGLEKTVRHTTFDLIGLSVSTTAQAGAVGSVILSLLRCCKGAVPALMIGGSYYRDRSGTSDCGRARIVGVDAPLALAFAEQAVRVRETGSLRS